MTVKLKQKQEALTLRIQKEEQQKTSSMVQKHSQQMLDLLKSKEDELKQQLEMELVSTLTKLEFRLKLWRAAG